MHNNPEDTSMRLDSYLAHAGIASRREAKDFVKRGLISVNGKKSTEPGMKVFPEKDEITVSEKIAKKIKEKETVLVYKPRGYVSSPDSDEGVLNIFDSFPHFRHLNCVGRLDKESEGLILLSNDGLITKAITGKDHRIEKEYIVTTRERVPDGAIVRMEKGMRLEDGSKTLPAKVQKNKRNVFTIILKEGKKHQIRRMANACRLTIDSLKRVRIHNLEIGSMKPGHFSKLTQEEVDDIKRVGLAS